MMWPTHVGLTNELADQELGISKEMAACDLTDAEGIEEFMELKDKKEKLRKESLQEIGELRAKVAVKSLFCLGAAALAFGTPI